MLDRGECCLIRESGTILSHVCTPNARCRLNQHTNTVMAERAERRSVLRAPNRQPSQCV